MNNIKETIFEDYDSVVFDLDRTIWDCFTSQGTSIGAYAMQAPFELKSGVLIKDTNGNYCKLQEGVRTLIKSLDADNMNLGIVSSGEQENVTSNAQPSVMMLKKFHLHKYFNLYVVCKQGINKREYVRPFGRTLFIDDDEENIEQVKVNEKVDVLNRKVFEDWDELFQKKTSTLHFGLANFIIKRADEDFKYASGVDTLYNLYQAELDYTITNRRAEEGDEVTDEDNVRYLIAKMQIPKLFDTAIKYLQDMLSSTIEFSKERITDSGLEEFQEHHKKLLPRFESALVTINSVVNYTHNEDQWPQVFIAVDNVINLMHGDLPYIAHLLQEDAERLEGEYEDYVTEQKIPDADALSGIDINVKQLEDKWDEFLEFLNKQGKSLNFNTASQKVAWEQQPEEPSPASEGAGYWINRDDMEDIFVMARDYPGEVPRVDNATFAEQLRHQEGYDFSDLEWDYEIIKTWTQTPQPIGEVKIWQEIANKVGVNLRYTQAT